MFGEQIRAARLEKGLSESQLARDAGVSRSQLRDLERDKNVQIATLLKVAARLPNLTYLRLTPGEVPETVDAQAVCEAAHEIARGLQKLGMLTGNLPLPNAGPDDVHAAASNASQHEDEELREIEEEMLAGRVAMEEEV